MIVDPEVFVERHREEGSILVLYHFQPYSLVKVCILVEGRILINYITVLLKPIQRYP